jgi:hypothetical protein
MPGLQALIFLFCPQVWLPDVNTDAELELHTKVNTVADLEQLVGSAVSG